VQHIPTGQPLGFHVDKDESIASNQMYLSHPEYSSILYLTDNGGPTLVLDQYSPNGNGYSPRVPHQGEISYPTHNKYVVFNGDLLHGVLPGDHNRYSGVHNQRTTFLVNYWNDAPEEPNCKHSIDYDVAASFGLKLYTRDEMKALQKRLDDAEAATAAADATAAARDAAVVTDNDNDDDDDDAAAVHGCPPRSTYAPTSFCPPAVMTPSFFKGADGNKNVRRGADMNSYPFTITLPGRNGDEEYVRLPVDYERGATQTLLWRLMKKEKAARKAEKAEAAAAEAAAANVEGDDDGDDDNATGGFTWDEL
jgi:hypothetical protein